MTPDSWMCGLEALGNELTQNLALEAQDLEVDETCLRLHNLEMLWPVLSFLRDDLRYCFQQMIDVCGVDYPSRPKRFDVVYHLLSLMHNRRVRLKVAVDASTSVPSVTSLFPSAGWWEREAYDMYGIIFSDHPDLRRILTDYGFEGHPLRKDFPLTGFTEVRYDAQQGAVVSQPVHLDQPYRDFDCVGPWQGCLAPKGPAHD